MGQLTRGGVSFFAFSQWDHCGQPQAYQVYMLRDPAAKRYPAQDARSGLLLLYFSVGVGVKAFVLNGRLPPLGSPDQATPSLRLNVTPIVLAALVFSGIAAATMSAANSFINIGAAIVTHDLPVAFGRRVKDELRWGRAVTILIAVAAHTASARAWWLFSDFRLGIIGRRWSRRCSGLTGRSNAVEAIASIGPARGTPLWRSIHLKAFTFRRVTAQRGDGTSSCFLLVSCAPEPRICIDPTSAGMEL